MHEVVHEQVRERASIVAPFVAAKVFLPCDLERSWRLEDLVPHHSAAWTEGDREKILGPELGYLEFRDHGGPSFLYGRDPAAEV